MGKSELRAALGAQRCSCLQLCFNKRANVVGKAAGFRFLRLLLRHLVRALANFGTRLDLVQQRHHVSFDAVQRFWRVAFEAQNQHWRGVG